MWIVTDHRQNRDAQTKGAKEGCDKRENFQLGLKGKA